MSSSVVGSAYLEFPAGMLRIEADANGLSLIEFTGSAAETARSARLPEGSLLREAVNQLEAYFDGKLRDFDLPLAPRGTPFQILVWRALTRIPYGKTVSYSELARDIGRPQAVRAVGAANGQNPLPIVIPCHRVIGKDGRLTGYGGGLHIKEFLLSLESRIDRPGLFDPS